MKIPRPLRNTLFLTAAAGPYAFLLCLAVFTPGVEIDLTPREVYKPATWIMAPIELDQGGEDQAPEGLAEAPEAEEPAVEPPAPAEPAPPAEPAVAENAEIAPSSEVKALVSDEGIYLADATAIEAEDRAINDEIEAARALIDAQQDELADEEIEGDEEIPLIDRRISKVRKPPARGLRGGKGGAQAKAKSAPKGPKCVDPTPGIVQVSEDEFEIDAAIVAHYAHDLVEASKLAYVSWAYNDAEEIIGFKVRRIRCGSPLWQAGLRNGDVITAINGRTITTIPQALKAYRKFKKKDNFRLEVLRKGETLNYRYKLV